MGEQVQRDEGDRQREHADAYFG
jgi:hypothetical protein